MSDAVPLPPRYLPPQSGRRKRGELSIRHRDRQPVLGEQVVSTSYRYNGTTTTAVPTAVPVGLAGGTQAAFGVTFEDNPIWGIATGLLPNGGIAESRASGKPFYYGNTASTSWHDLTGASVSLESLLSGLSFAAISYFNGSFPWSFLDVSTDCEIDLKTCVDGAILAMKEIGGNSMSSRFYNNENWGTTAWVPAVRLAITALGFGASGGITQLDNRDIGISQLVNDGFDENNLANSIPFDVDGGVTARITRALLAQYPVVRFIMTLVVGGANMYPRALRDSLTQLVQRVGYFFNNFTSVDVYDLVEHVLGGNDELLMSGIPLSNLT